MTVDGILFDPARLDDALLDIDGFDYHATGWAAAYGEGIFRHVDGCHWAPYGVPAAVCTCQPPL